MLELPYPVIDKILYYFNINELFEISKSCNYFRQYIQDYPRYRYYLEYKKNNTPIGYINYYIYCISINYTNHLTFFRCHYTIYQYTNNNKIDEVGKILMTLIKKYAPYNQEQKQKIHAIFCHPIYKKILDEDIINTC